MRTIKRVEVARICPFCFEGCYAIGFSGELVGGCEKLKRGYILKMACKILGGKVVKENDYADTIHTKNN